MNLSREHSRLSDLEGIYLGSDDDDDAWGDKEAQGGGAGANTHPAARGIPVVNNGNNGNGNAPPGPSPLRGGTKAGPSSTNPKAKTGMKRAAENENENEKMVEGSDSESDQDEDDVSPISPSKRRILRRDAKRAEVDDIDDSFMPAGKEPLKPSYVFHLAKI